MTDIPIIDLNNIRYGDEKSEQEIASLFREIYTKIGFAYIINHGIPVELINRALDVSKTFYNLSEESKARYILNNYFRGYIGKGRAVTKRSSQGENFNPNLSESLMIGFAADSNQPNYCKNFLTGPNQWPDVPNFKTTIQAYWHECDILAKKITRLIALAYNLPPAGLDHLFTDPASFIRLLHYPIMPTDLNGEWYGVAPHTDYGFITFVAQDQEGGLQVKTANGEWLDVKPLPGSLVLNTGDFLKQISNDFFLSTPHRVINSPLNDRYSIAFFYNPNLDAKMISLKDYRNTNYENKPSEAKTFLEYMTELLQANFKLY